MDIKKKIEELAQKIKADKNIAAKFAKDPVKTVEELLGVNLPKEQINTIIVGIKAKIGSDGASGILGSVKKLF